MEHFDPGGAPFHHHEFVEGFDEVPHQSRPDYIQPDERSRVLTDECRLAHCLINAAIEAQLSSLGRFANNDNRSCFPRGRSPADLFVLAKRLRERPHGTGIVSRPELANALVDVANFALFGPRDIQTISCFAPCQSGKADLANALRIFLPLWGLHSGKNVHCVMMPHVIRATNKRNEEDAERTRAIYGSICLADDTSVTVTNMNGDMFDGDRTMRRTRMSYLEPLLDSMIGGRIDTLLLIIDEADHASAKNGMLGKMLRQIHEAAETHGIYVRMICISATDYEIRGGEKTHCVNMIPGSDYIGLVYGGRQINIRTWTAIAANMGISSLSTAIEMRKHGDERIDDVSSMLIKLIRGVEDKHAGLNGKPCNGGRGIVVRFGTELQTEALIRAFERHVHEAGLSTNVIRFYGQHSVRLGNQFDHVLTDDQPNIVFVTGGLRRGERVCSSLLLIIDFAKEPSTGEALVQGLIGRRCGFGFRDECVMVSPAFLYEVNHIRRNFAESGKEQPLMHLTRATFIGEGIGRYLSRGTLRIEAVDLPERIRVRLEAAAASIIDKFIEPFKAQQERSRRLDGSRASTGGQRRERWRVMRPQRNLGPGPTWNPAVRVAIPRADAETQTPYYEFSLEALFGGADNLRDIENFYSEMHRVPMTFLRVGQQRLNENGEVAEYVGNDGFVRVSLGSQYGAATGGDRVHDRTLRGRNGVQEIDERNDFQITDETINLRRKIVLINYEITRFGKPVFRGLTVQLAQDLGKVREIPEGAIVPIATAKSLYDQYTVSDDQRSQRERAKGC